MRTWTGGELKMQGSLPVEVNYAKQKAHLHLMVVAKQWSKPAGRDWLAKLKLDWQVMNKVQSA